MVQSLERAKCLLAVAADVVCGAASDGAGAAVKVLSGLFH
jgi:hypothetical protein